MKRTNPIKQRLDAYAQVNRYIRAQAADFGKIYDAARREITDRLRREAVSAAKRGSIPHSARLLAAMEQVYPRLEAAYRERFKEAIPYVAQSAYFMALNDLKLGGREFDADRVKLTLEDAYTHIAGMTANMKKKDVAFLRETVAGVEREAAMTGMTARQVTAELLTRLESRPEGFKFVDAGNRVWDSRAYCEMLARTTLLNTSRQEYLDTCAENGADVVCVTVSGHCCDKCAEWENRLLSISGATKGLPTVEEATAAGLFHPNCTHSLTEVDDYTREEEYNPDGTPKNGLNSSEDEHDEDHDHAAAAPGTNTGSGTKYASQFTSLDDLAKNGGDRIPVGVSRETEELSRQLGCNAIPRDTTIHEILKEVNPHYKGDPAHDLYSVNCQRAVYAYEARRRGLDVVAKPALDLDFFKDPIAQKYLKMMNGQAADIYLSPDKIAERISAMSDGERAVIKIDWNSKSGHAFIAEKINGKMMLIDPQTGKDASDYLDKAKKDGTFIFSRIDNLKFDVKLLAEYCEARKP